MNRFYSFPPIVILSLVCWHFFLLIDIYFVFVYASHPCWEGARCCLLNVRNAHTLLYLRYRISHPPLVGFRCRLAVAPDFSQLFINFYCCSFYFADFRSASFPIRTRISTGGGNIANIPLPCTTHSRRHLTSFISFYLVGATLTLVLSIVCWHHLNFFFCNLLPPKLLLFREWCAAETTHPTACVQIG